MSASGLPQVPSLIGDSAPPSRSFPLGDKQDSHFHRLGVRGNVRTVGALFRLWPGWGDAEGVRRTQIFPDGNLQANICPRRQLYTHWHKAYEWPKSSRDWRGMSVQTTRRNWFVSTLSVIDWFLYIVCLFVFLFVFHFRCIWSNSYWQVFEAKSRPFSTRKTISY